MFFASFFCFDGSFVTESSVEEKIVERALQKLRLDQLVIQSGRTANAASASSKTLSPEEMLGMIRHGAQDILNASAAQTINSGEKKTDGEDAFEVDMEALLRKGEERTKELQAKYQNAGLDDLQRFESSIPAEQQQTNDELAWITAPSKPESSSSFASNSSFYGGRQRAARINYSMDGFYREDSAGGGGLMTRRAPQPPGHPHIMDFQFYPKGLKELLDRERYAYQRTLNYKYPAEHPDRQTEQSRVDTATPLTPPEERQKEQWLKSPTAFPTWTRKDFQAFVKACERYGRTSYDRISAEVETKSVDEVASYSKAFWERAREDLDDADKLIAAIERGEARLARVASVNALLQDLFFGANGGKRKAALAIPYHLDRPGQQASSAQALWTESEDRFILKHVASIGYSHDAQVSSQTSAVTPPTALWESLKRAIEDEPDFTFDWYLRTRTTSELTKRFNKLLGLFEKQINAATQQQPSSQVIIDAASEPGKRKRTSNSQENRQSKEIRRFLESVHPPPERPKTRSK